MLKLFSVLLSFGYKNTKTTQNDVIIWFDLDAWMDEFCSYQNGRLWLNNTSKNISSSLSANKMASLSKYFHPCDANVEPYNIINCYKYFFTYAINTPTEKWKTLECVRVCWVAYTYEQRSKIWIFDNQTNKLK